MISTLIRNCHSWRSLERARTSEVNYLRELVELQPEKETLLDLDPANTSRKLLRRCSQKIRRAVKREERANAPKRP